MSKKRLFGTDGIRGIANIYPMTVEMAMQIGRASAYVFRNESRRHRIVIGKDTRLSGYMLENALTAGISSMGVDILLVGPLPTPGIAFLTSNMNADAGIIISASHNPFYDNGIKFFSNNGFKLPDEIELEIERLVFSKDLLNYTSKNNEIGKAFRVEDAIGRYIVFIKNSFPKNITLNGLKIVVDCANGATYKVAPTVFDELGADVIAVGVKPNGENINLNCGSMHPEFVSRVVKSHGADLGVAFDGDGDRVIFVDENGNLVDGDKIMAICAIDMIKEDRLNKNTVVATVMSNMGLEIALNNFKGKVIRTPVGDRYVVEKMVDGDYNLGGEKSGHIIFFDYTTTGDGIISALQLLAIIKKNGKRLSELTSIIKEFPQALVNVKVKKKIKIENVPEISSTIKDIKKKLNKQGRVLVRYSGTEPVLRIMVEGENEDKIKDIAYSIADKVRLYLGVDE
jgi:phosphoglucosamine mutase